ncbi:hypothetical protein BJV74DRAFT_949584 [Russula compacta]|nr:hypothetical protein BJV74DRAFT_949584 [Russula compacta]
MPGPLKDTKLTDFFHRCPAQLFNTDSPQSSSQPPPLYSLRSAPSVEPSPPVVTKRKPGRPKRSGKKAKHVNDQPVHVLSSSRSSYPSGSSGPRLPRLQAPGSSPLESGTSGPSSKRRSGRPKERKNKDVDHKKNAYLLRSSLKVDSRGSLTTTSSLNLASQPRSKVLYSSPKEYSSSPQALTPSKRKLDDDDDTVSITSSGVPLSLYYTPRQRSSPSSSEPPDFPLITAVLSSSLSNKRRHLMPPRVTPSLQAPVTPKKSRDEIIPTSQSSEVGLYSPIRPNTISRCGNDIQDSVENWRHGRTAYRCAIVSPLPFSPEGDYSVEIDRPPSPLTSCPDSTSLGLGSPLSSFTDVDAILSDVDLDGLGRPTPLPQRTIPSPSSSSGGKAHLALKRFTMPPPLRPVTPPPSSPEREQSIPVPVAPKDSKIKTAEIVAEIWANVRANSISDSEDSYLHVPFKDELSSEEEDDEPFWKRNRTSACHVTPASIVGCANRDYAHVSLPSPSSPSLPRLSISPDNSLLQHNDHDDYRKAVPDFPISDPISPLVDIRKRPTRTRRLTRAVNPSTLTTKPDVRKADPINAMLRQRKREARAGGGIDALNRAECYDHDTLLSDFSIEEAAEPLDIAAPTKSSSVGENTTRVVTTGPQTDDAADISTNVIEDEVQQDERERLLGAKEGEAVGKILDADRRMGQSAGHSVPGVSVFVHHHEDSVDTVCDAEARPIWELAKDKTARLEMLSEAIKRQDIEYMQVVFGILTAEDMVVPGVAQWLCEQALWYRHEHLGRFSRKFLLEMPLWARSYPGSPLSVTLLIRTMMGLGLRKDLSTHLLSLPDVTFPHLQYRPKVLGSMIKMIASFVPRWSMEQLPDVVILLLLIGVDRDTTAELRRGILHTISLLCRRLPLKSDSIEISVAKRVLDLTKTFSATDQALLLSFFTKASPSCVRISRAVAYHVLTGLIISPASYSLPPLGPLISVLSNPDEPFSITDSTDYDALTSRIVVLGVALSGIESYVAEESALRKLAHMPEGSPRKKEAMPLELIRVRLDAIHGRIFDTRAAHLDRSRAKGAIQRLSMCVHYQRAALSKTGGQLRLGDFFSPGGNSRQPKRKNWS